MADLSDVPAIIQTGKTLFEMIIKIGNNEIVNGIATIMGLSGFSLRDFIGKKQLSKMIHKLKCHFKGKEITEKQEEILRESFLELEDYIKNCEELDEKVFENISNIIVKGIDNEDILTREYIKILKKMSWIDLIVLKKVYKVENSSRYEVEKLPKDLDFDYDEVPYELVILSLKKLEKIGIIGIREDINSLFPPKIYSNNHLGSKIVSLIKDKIE